MAGTVLLLGGWISTYFGISFVWAGHRFDETDENEDPRRFLLLPGYCLLLAGALLLGFGVLRHYHLL